MNFNAGIFAGKSALHVPLQDVGYALGSSQYQISVLRDDLIHPFISGNKMRKLKYNLIRFRENGKKILLTFGGAFSNHLVAVAAASKENGFKSIGIVRGEEVENDYLNFSKQAGMHLHFISRSDFRNKGSIDYLKSLVDEFISIGLIDDEKDVFILPEGGANEEAVRGAAEIMDDIPATTNIIAVACGTGATLAGITRRLLPHQHAIGISVLKAENYFENELVRLGGKLSNTTIIYDYHFGGYAKKSVMLDDFIRKFMSKTGIPIEPVYSGKLFFAIDDLTKQGYFKKGSKVTLIHTGGIFNFNSSL